jgi:hypothetical protein
VVALAVSPRGKLLRACVGMKPAPATATGLAVGAPFGVAVRFAMWTSSQVVGAEAAGPIMKASRSAPQSGPPMNGADLGIRGSGWPPRT